MPTRFHFCKKQWKAIAPLLPGKDTDPGYTAHDNRLDLEAMITIAREGHSWRGFDADFGRWGTIYQRMYRWEQQGVFDNLFDQLIAKRGVGSLIVDGTIVAVHQDGTGARKIYGGPEAQAIGKSRGGRTTKIIAACDEDGNVFNLLVVPGNHNESPYTAQLIQDIEADFFIADKAYDADDLLNEIAQRQTEVVVPPRSNRLVQRQYDKEKYKTRNLIERAFQKMKRFRGIATRYKKTARMYVALIILILVYLVTKIGKSALRMVHIWRPEPLHTDYEIYVPRNLQEEYQRLHFQRRADFDWFSPPNQQGRISSYP